MTSGAVSLGARSRLRRPTGEPSRKVSAAFFLVAALGARRMATAASLREVRVLRVVVLLPVAGFDVLVDGFVARAPVAVVDRAPRAVVAGFAVRVPRDAVPLLAVLRAVVVARVAEAARLVAGALAARVEPRVVDFAAVVRLRAAAEALAFAAGLRAGALRAALARLVAALRAGAALLRVVVVLVARAGELLVVARAAVLPALVLRVAVDLLARLFAAAERDAGLLALRMVRAVVLRPFDAAVLRPPVRTAMARVRRPGVLSSLSLLTV